ncbi:ABC multidrug transporter mdr1 [Grosmannia clavigera kw1407]|uniref:ABC multidrug transporter mdr1 n=1 Tax=Grosmannia clavigera (strain kw1407 / UAMH 11150) TaxID=655863 RepID=F0XV87_GROCL|nr:ABC multidrug transporter mdr1 [Grosmannia clavigera kw1407]EFW98992.1 ABC multidrug transporter mdr1 [Grosmannia clavigera kw1407]
MAVDASDQSESHDSTRFNNVDAASEEKSIEEGVMALTPNHEDVLKDQITGPVTWQGSVRFLLSCTSTIDGLVLGSSAVAAIIGGAATPFAMLLLGNMGQSFRGFFMGHTTLDKFSDEVANISLLYVYLAIVEFSAIYFATVGFTMAGDRIAQRVREKYLAAVLRQNIAYFDGLAIGEVNTLLDGVDISTQDVSWLRQKIGLVEQDPTLFSTSVYENIRFGLVGSAHENLDDAATQKLVEDAARLADAYDFIMALPEGFSTNVGDSGSLISGGQKQRIAIARAVIGDPRILLLDEATSALDANAERRVQRALENASKGRTTISIAHRLSTITRADNILVMSEGRIVEQGLHTTLMEYDGIYSKLIQHQSVQDPGRNRTEVDVPLQEGVDKDVSPRHSELIKQSTGSTATILEEKTTASSIWSLALFVFGLNPKGRTLILLGALFSIVAGASHPAQSVFLAKIIAALSQNPSEHKNVREEVDFWSWMYFMIGFTTVGGWLGQGVCLAYYSQRLTHIARVKGLDTVLHHDIGTFSRNDHSTAALTSILSTSASSLQGLSGAVLGTLLVVLTVLVAGFALSTAIGWKLALVCATTTPIQIACGIIRLKCVAMLEGHSRQVYESSAIYACEYGSNIRTVAALTLERTIQKTYHRLLEMQRKKSLLLVSQSSLLYAASQSLNFLCVSLTFWYGSRLVTTEGYTMFQFFVCYTAIIAGSFSAGAIFSFAPDIGKARDSAERMQALFCEPVNIDVREDGGSSFDNTDGTIELKNVSFRYPSRPEHMVLDDINITILSGKYIALVGSSGSGKSTIISLLERFFDPDDGQVFFGSQNIKDRNLRNYRRQLALVSQSATLFDGTIRDNIIFGVEDENFSEEAVMQACKDANILDFISSLP